MSTSTASAAATDRLPLEVQIDYDHGYIPGEEERVALLAFGKNFHGRYFRSPDDEILPGGHVLGDPIVEYLGEWLGQEDHLDGALGFQEWVDAQEAYAKGTLRVESYKEYTRAGVQFLGTADAETLQQAILGRANERLLFATVYAYVHSGVAFSLSGFSCSWDSGVVGVAVTNREDFQAVVDPKGELDTAPGGALEQRWREIVEAELDDLTAPAYMIDIEDAEGERLGIPLGGVKLDSDAGNDPLQWDPVSEMVEPELAEILGHTPSQDEIQEYTTVRMC